MKLSIFTNLVREQRRYLSQLRSDAWGKILAAADWKLAFYFPDKSTASAVTVFHAWELAAVDRGVTVADLCRRTACCNWTLLWRLYLCRELGELKTSIEICTENFDQVTCTIRQSDWPSCWSNIQSRRTTRSVRHLAFQLSYVFL